MTNADWKQRLQAAIDASTYTQRSASLKAGRGPGYINSLLKSGKTPSVENLMGVCEVIGVSPTFVLWGVDVQAEDAEVIAAMREDPDTRDAILALLRRRRKSGGHSQ